MNYALKIRPRLLLLTLATILLTLTACEGGAVVYAPTPLPPDLSPMRYEHPSDAFSISVPRDWSVYTQNRPALASAAFSRPSDPNPALTVAVVNLGEAVAPESLGEIMTAYQGEYRPDLLRYREQDRQALGDGSWRLSGVRTVSGGTQQQVNTFIEAAGNLVAVTEVVVSTDAAERDTFEAGINSLRINPDADLQVSGLGSLSFARPVPLDALNVSAWSNAEGVFFVTGEIANYGDIPVSEVPVRVSLLSQEGSIVLEALDTAMGHGIPPGGFAPFSLRFGQGRPAEAAAFSISVDDPNGSVTETMIYSNDQLNWTDESQFTDGGDLLVTGTVTNTGSAMLRSPLALVTVFDFEQNVIGAWFAPLLEDRIAPGASLPFEVRVSELGADPYNYIVEIQALGEGL
jgi:hypothetical protein